VILMIDNYDSFTYNLYQLIGSTESNISVIRNDECTIKDIECLKPRLIVISPGPGKPSEAGICIDMIRYFSGKVAMFGVCLGHQAICEAFGGVVSYAKCIMHGKTSLLNIDNSARMFKDFPSSINVARYHSLSAQQKDFPSSLRIVARDEDNEIMALEHKTYPIFGVQFHPESVMTPLGESIIANILKEIR